MIGILEVFSNFLVIKIYENYQHNPYRIPKSRISFQLLKKSFTVKPSLLYDLRWDNVLSKHLQPYWNLVFVCFLDVKLQIQLWPYQTGLTAFDSIWPFEVSSFVYFYLEKKFASRQRNTQPFYCWLNSKHKSLPGKLIWWTLFLV